MMWKRGFVNIIIYLEDFLVIGATQAECTHAYEVLLQLLQDLGFTISQRKLVLPARKLTFLGVELDTISYSMALPQEKLHECQTIVSSFLHKGRLAGKLNWACRIVYGESWFLRRVLSILDSLPLGAKHRLAPSFYRDIARWVQFLQAFNRNQFLLHDRPTVDVISDRFVLSQQLTSNRTRGSFVGCKKGTGGTGTSHLTTQLGGVYILTTEKL